MWSDDNITLATPGPDLTFNATSGDNYWLDPEQCDWVPDVRITVDDAPRQHGAIIFPPLLGAGHLRLGGRLKPATDTAAARDSMAATMRAAALALMGGGTGTFTHPTRGAVAVVTEVFPIFPGNFRKSFQLVLITGDPGGW